MGPAVNTYVTTPSGFPSDLTGDVTSDLYGTFRANIKFYRCMVLLTSIVLVQ